MVLRQNGSLQSRIVGLLDVVEIEESFRMMILGLAYALTDKGMERCVFLLHNVEVGCLIVAILSRKE
jgi:hypothetical protein